MDTILGIPIPFTWPERVASISALITVLFGICLLVAPSFSLKLLRLQTLPDVPGALSEARGTMAGFYLGVGLLALLLQQPLIFAALATGWIFTAFGRFVSMLLDPKLLGGFNTFNIGSMIFEATLGLAALWPATEMFSGAHPLELLANSFMAALATLLLAMGLSPV
ncbi:MAG: DUF4345 family protein [Pseudomonadota bacterium]